MEESFRLRISYSGPDEKGLFTARAEGLPSEVEGTGGTREEARSKVINALGPAIPQGAVQALFDAESSIGNVAARPRGVRRYWQNLARGWIAVGALMCLYGANDKSGLAVAGSVSFIVWGVAVLLNFGGAADTISTGRTREIRIVNGAQQRSGVVTALALAGIVVGGLLTVLFVHRHY